MVDICTLPSRAVFRLTGSDAGEWLQGLITNDMARLEVEGALYAALLSPQGKILFDFLVYQAADSFLIDCEAASLEPLMKRLSMYRLRSDVVLTVEPSLEVISSCTPLDTALPFVDLAVRDPRLDQLGYRMVGDAALMRQEYESQGHRVDDESVYRDYMLKLGVPNGAADFAPGKAYPLESNFEELNGVSFTKGCFIGQEIVARMKHKAVLKKRTLPFTTDGGTPAPGSAVCAGDAKAGDVISSSGAAGLATIRLEEWRQSETAELSLEADDVRITIAIPDWLNLKEELSSL